VCWLAILDSDLLLFGTIGSVHQELDRYLAGGTPDSPLVRRLDHLRHDDQLGYQSAGKFDDGFGSLV
jgi:hypothetical protein